MTTYAVTVMHPQGFETTVRYVDHGVLVKGLTSFGGIQLFGTEPSPILSFKAERHTPTADEVTCNNKFDCE